MDKFGYFYVKFFLLKTWRYMSLTTCRVKRRCESRGMNDSNYTVVNKCIGFYRCLKSLRNNSPKKWVFFRENGGTFQHEAIRLGIHPVKLYACELKVWTDGRGIYRLSTFPLHKIQVLPLLCKKPQKRFLPDFSSSFSWDDYTDSTWNYIAVRRGDWVLKIDYPLSGHSVFGKAFSEGMRNTDRRYKKSGLFSEKTWRTVLNIVMLWTRYSLEASKTIGEVNGKNRWTTRFSKIAGRQCYETYLEAIQGWRKQ